MKGSKTFAAYRYFLIPSDQISLYDTVKEKRNEAVEKFFRRVIEDKKISFDVDDRKQVLAFERKIADTVLLFVFGSEKHETKYRESDTGIESIIETNLPYGFPDSAQFYDGSLVRRAVPFSEEIEILCDCMLAKND